jgi:hypothetical protein
MGELNSLRLRLRAGRLFASTRLARCQNGTTHVVPKDVRLRPRERQAASVHDSDSWGSAGDRSIVGYEDHRQSTLSPQLLQKFYDLVPCVGVEVAGWLVGQKYGGVLGEGARDSDALLLATR